MSKYGYRDNKLKSEKVTTDDIEAGTEKIGSIEIEASAITTEKLAAGAATKPKIGYKSVAVTVAAAATSGSSAADSELVDGEIVGIYPTGNQDQFVDNVVLNADGSVTVTSASAATADNTFNVVVLAP